jgi:hypothetical protein
VRRHRIDPLSAALGLTAAGAGLAVATGHADPLVGNAVWWVAIAAVLLGIAIVPWHRGERAADPDTGPASGADGA